MDKEMPDSPLLRKYIIQSEPCLRREEKETLWRAIEQQTTQRPTTQRWKWYAAACVVAIVIGSGLLRYTFQEHPYSQMAGLVNVDTLQHICLYLDEQQVELGDQVEIICHPSSNQVEIRTAGVTSFKLSALQQKETYLQLAVPAGKKAQVILADQSRITLRERTKFGFPLQLKDKERKVRLEGEAYMQITHNVDKRFITETRDIDVTVLGTEYLVSAYPQDSEQSVLLVSGQVEVASSMGNKLVLAPNQRYIYNTMNKKATLARRVDPGTYLSWKENMLEVSNEPLSDVLKKIESIYHISFNYDWNELARVHISGKLDVTVPINTLLERLTKIAPIQLDAQKRSITLRKNPKKE